MRSTGRTLTAGFLVLTGTGLLMLSGASIAHAQPVAAPAPATCKELGAAQNSYTAGLKANVKKFEADNKAYVTFVTNYGNEVIRIASQGSPALQSAAKTYATDLETEIANSDFNATRINADSDRLIVLGCTPKGAPATGGGSSAALQDPALFGAGGAAALAGLIVVGLTLRGRSRASADHA